MEESRMNGVILYPDQTFLTDKLSDEINYIDCLLVYRLITRVFGTRKPRSTRGWATNYYLCMRYDYNGILNREDLLDIINECTTFTDIMRKLDLPVRGKMYVTLKKKLLERGYNLSHLTGIPKHKKNWKTIDEHLSNGSTTQSSKLKHILIKNGLKLNKCEICGIEDWNGKPLNMQLHHIDGNPKNNTIENLQILCPNCHAQTDGYCSSNKNKDNQMGLNGRPR